MTATARGSPVGDLLIDAKDAVGICMCVRVCTLIFSVCKRAHPTAINCQSAGDPPPRALAPPRAESIKFQVVFFRRLSEGEKSKQVVTFPVCFFSFFFFIYFFCIFN